MLGNFHRCFSSDFAAKTVRCRVREAYNLDETRIEVKCAKLNMTRILLMNNR
jgi:hypothetical protein